MAAYTTPILIFGAGQFTKEHGHPTAESVKPWLEALLKTKSLAGEIDTAAAYPESEQYLGQCGFGAHGFTLGTKICGGANPQQPATRESVIAQGKECLTKLCVDQVDILFIHAPDARVPFEDTLSGIDALHQEGAFKRFGLSNHTAEQVEEVVNICKEKGFVAPSVFEGSYNAFARGAEQKLLPILRTHKIAFYAYSPIAGGFPAHTSQQFRDQSFQGGRWDMKGFLGQVYQFQYNNDKSLAVLDSWHEIAAAAGISSVEMAYRWIAHNSTLDGALGDGIIIGASTIDQWNSNLAAIQKGPLDSETAAKIDGLWGPDLNVLDNWQAIKGLMAAKQAAARQ